mgnify:FL=1
MAPILIYHTIDNYDEPRPAGVDCPPTLFADHMNWLHKNCRVIPLQELTEEYLTKGKTPPSDAAALTFDDGYLDNFEKAYPVLRDLKLPATIFCVTKYLNSTWPADDWGGIKKPMLGTDELKEMAASGISFGSHGHSHVELTTLSKEDVLAEMKTSRDKLEKLTGQTPLYISYPFGSFNDDVMTVAEEAGYKAGFTVWTKEPSHYSLNRLPIHRKDEGLRFQLKVKHYEWVKPILASFR